MTRMGRRGVLKARGAMKALAVAGAVAVVASGCSSAEGGPESSAGTASGGVVDASTCPAQASQALDNGEALKVGTVWPMSGPYAAVGTPIVEGMKAYFAKVNASGGVEGHELELVAKDDGYDPTKTLPQVTELFKVGVQDFAGLPLSKLAIVRGTGQFLAAAAREKLAR